MTFNRELALKTLDYIKANPDKWDQSNCGNCFGGLTYKLNVGDFESRGWMGIETYRNGREFYMLGEVKKLLGFEETDHLGIFHRDNTIEDLEAYIEEYSKTPV